MRKPTKLVRRRCSYGRCCHSAERLLLLSRGGVVLEIRNLCTECLPLARQGATGIGVDLSEAPIT